MMATGVRVAMSPLPPMLLAAQAETERETEYMNNLKRLIVLKS
ncbi:MULTISPECIES: hypothetical protein [unclassified Roseitalea]|nr:MULTISPECIES: hypothetical protein [unclassified Roseitalea]